MASAPYLKSGKWFVDKDPDDELYYVANVTADLTDSATTAVSFETIATGVTVIEAAAPQGNLGGLLAVKVGGGPGSLTFRVTCANTEQFDRTINFATEDH